MQGDGQDRLAEQRAQAPVLGAMVAEDGRTIDLYALVSDGEPLGAGELTAQVDQSAGTGAVHVLVRRRTSAATAAVVCRLSHDVHVLRITLDAPLAGRNVVDDATDVGLTPVAASAVLRPAALPSGWALIEEHPLREGDRQTGWTQRYGTTDAEVSVSVSQRLASLGSDERYSTDRDDIEPTSVRGAAATFSRQRNWNATSLLWREGDWSVALSSSSPDGTRPAFERPALEAFAASMTAGAMPAVGLN